MGTECAVRKKEAIAQRLAYSEKYVISCCFIEFQHSVVPNSKLFWCRAYKNSSITENLSLLTILPMKSLLTLKAFTFFRKKDKNFAI